MTAITAVVHTVYQLVYRPNITFDPRKNIDAIRECSDVFIVLVKGEMTALAGVAVCIQYLLVQQVCMECCTMY